MCDVLRSSGEGRGNGLMGWIVYDLWDEVEGKLGCALAWEDCMRVELGIVGERYMDFAFCLRFSEAYWKDDETASMSTLAGWTYSLHSRRCS
jgi:hypothetical protein